MKYFINPYWEDVFDSIKERASEEVLPNDKDMYYWGRSITLLKRGSIDKEEIQGLLRNEQKKGVLISIIEEETI